MTEHTEGPWFQKWEKSARTVYAEGQPGGLAMVACYPYEEEEANARLIAAAPDLLEAARELLEFPAHTSDFHPDAPERAAASKLNAALKKAEGKA